MGSIESVPCTLSSPEIQALKESSVFNAVEIRAIWCYYNFLSLQEEKIARRYFHITNSKHLFYCSFFKFS
jgi:hypothetical protein